MNRKDSRRMRIAILALVVLAIGIFLEVVVFNFNHFKIARSERGLYNVSVDNISLNGLKRDSNGLYVTGKEAYFEVPVNRYAAKVRLNFKQGSQSFKVYTKDINGNISMTYTSNSDIKGFLNIDINENIKNIKFYVEADSSKQSIGLQSVDINNKFYFNIIRFLLTIVIIYILLAIVIFKKYLQKNLHVSFIAISLALGTMFIICVPQYYSYDESAHFLRSYETASFDFNFSKTKQSKWISNIDAFTGYSGHGGLYNSYVDRIDSVVPFFNNDYTNEKHINSPEDTYLFVPYIPQSIGIFVGKTLRLPFILTFYLGRFFSLLVFSLLGGLIIKRIKIAKRLVFIILLFPCVILTAGAYSVDPMSQIFAIAAVAIFVNMLCEKENSIGYRQIAQFVACVAVTTMCKVPYAPLILLILAVPTNKFCKNKKRDKYLIKIIPLVIIGLVAIATFLYGESKNINQWGVPGVNVKGQVSFIIRNLPQYAYIIVKFISSSTLGLFQGAISSLAYCGGIDSVWFMIILITLFVVAIVDAEDDVLILGKTEKKIMVISIILSWGLVLTALYLTFTPVAKNTIDGVQGRYITPLLLPLLLLFKNNKISSKFNKEKLNYAIIVMTTIILIISAIYIYLQFSN